MATITERIKQFLNDILENRQLEKVQKDASAIQGMRNPSEAVQRVVIRADAYNIRYISNPTERIKQMAVEADPFSIRYIPNASEELKMKAVTDLPDAIQYIASPSESLKWKAVQDKGSAIQYISNPSDSLKWAAVQDDWSSIRYIPDASEKLKMAAVQRNGLAIQYISKPSEAVKMAAVQSNGYAIEFISNPTEEMKIEAVKNNAYSIIEMEEPTPSVCKIALEKMYGRPINVAMVEPTELAKKTQILLNNLVGLKFEYRTVYQTYGKAAEEDPLQMSIQEKKDKFRTEMEEKYPGMFQNKTQSTQKDHNTTNLKEQELYSSETKILIGDISSKKEITNLRIKDKITGKTEPLNSNGIRLLDQPSECIEKILSGKKVEFTTNSGKGYLTGLCKTPLGWGLTIGKQIQSSTDSSVTL